MAANSFPVKENSIAFGASATLIASIVSLCIGVFTHVLLARVLGPEIKGRVDLLVASGGLAAMVIGFSLTSGITFVVAQGQMNLRRLTWKLVVIGIIQGVAVWVMATAVSRTSFVNAFVPPEFVSWGAIGISALAMASILYGYGRAILSGLQRFLSGALADVIARILTAVAITGAIFWLKTDHDQAAITVIRSMIVVNFVAAVWMLGKAVLTGPDHENSSELRRVWQYSLPSYAGNLAQFANYRLDVFLVAYFVGVREVALYGAAVSLAQLLWLPSNALQSVLFPRISSMTKEHQGAENTAQIMRLIFFLTFVGGAVFALAAPWVIDILFGMQFEPSLLPLRLILPGVVFFCIANILCSYLAGIGKPQLNFYVSLIGLTATLVFDFILIPRMGIAGAAIGSSISYTISAGLSLVFFMRETNFSLTKTILLTKGDVQIAYHTLRYSLQKISSRY